MHRLLVVEDDPLLAEVVTDYLRANGYLVEHEVSGRVAALWIRQEVPDAVILDVNLPDQDGFAVCREVRECYSGVIVMLTARTDEVDEILGLECGADDYLTKPVRPAVLLARLRSHLRPRQAKPEAEESGVLWAGGLEISIARREVLRAGSVVSLTSAEFDLLLYLARRTGQPVSRRELHEALLGEHYSPRDRAIDLRVSRLRRKLGDSQQQPTIVKGIHGVGYFLSAEP
ncbi:MAG: response regulator transcription factor [Planctomycetaceae bacterium]